MLRSTLSALALSAALIGGAVAPAAAATFASTPSSVASRYVPGASASPAWSATPASRTPLAGRVDPQQNLLEASGATGGLGQHS